MPARCLMVSSWGTMLRYVLFLALWLLPSACSSVPVQYVEGTVFVIEHGNGWELVSVETQMKAVALYVAPPYQWEDGQCYRISYYDTETTSDGTLAGEPHALDVHHCQK